LAGVLAKAGQLQDAITIYREASRLAPGRADILIDLGNAYASLTNYVAAVTSYRGALQLQPTNPSILFNLGVVLDAQGNKSEAKTNLMEAARLNPALSDVVKKLLDRRKPNAGAEPSGGSL
jgi:Flp pilus assembly protein TadD